MVPSTLTAHPQMLALRRSFDLALVLAVYKYLYSYYLHCAHPSLLPSTDSLCCIVTSMLPRVLHLALRQKSVRRLSETLTPVGDRAGSRLDPRLG